MKKGDEMRVTIIVVSICLAIVCVSLSRCAVVQAQSTIAIQKVNNRLERMYLKHEDKRSRKEQREDVRKRKDASK